MKRVKLNALRTVDKNEFVGLKVNFFVRGDYLTQGKINAYDEENDYFFISIPYQDELLNIKEWNTEIQIIGNDEGGIIINKTFYQLIPNKNFTLYEVENILNLIEKIK